MTLAPEPDPVTVLWMSVVSGYLAGAIGWRGMFVAEGFPRNRLGVHPVATGG